MSGRLTQVAAWIALIILMVSIFAGAGSYLRGGLVHQLLGDSNSEEKLELIRSKVNSYGHLAGFVYLGAVVVEVVVAPLPGPFLYAPAGYLFGTWLGGTLALVGNLLGAFLAYSLAFSLGERLLPRPPERLMRKLESQGFLLVFLLRLNPFTSTDLISYAAGFARLRASSVVLATGLALAPSCYLYSWLAHEAFSRYPELFLPLGAVATVALAGLVFTLFRRKSL